MIANLDKKEWTKKLEATGLSHDQAAAIVDIIVLTITCDYSDQTRDKLLEDLMPMVSEWVIEGIKHSALCFEKSKDEPAFYRHMEVRDTQHTIDGEPVLVCLILWVERGVVKADTVCHIGSEKNVRAREAEYRNFMKEMTAEYKWSSFMQIDQEGGQPDSWLAGR
jgi:hypothetical protein